LKQLPKGSVLRLAVLIFLSIGEPAKGTLAMFSQTEAKTAASKVERDRAHPDRVLTFRQWAALNGFSISTGHRIIKAGDGPPIVQLSPRRIGVKESDNAKWQQARKR
jgi:predicted DNA-binding transcriptional regulator AlpA